MNHYGQSITWGTVAAPHLFTGVCTGYSYREGRQRQLDDDEAGELRVLIQHSRKAEISFDAKVTDESDDFLDLSGGAAITITGVNPPGLVLVRRAVERWSLGQPKTASVQATFYPDITENTTPLADTLSAFTPDQSAFFGATPLSQAIITPGNKLIYGTRGMTMPGTPAIGIIHELEISQELTIAEDEVSPAGTILGAATHGYLRTIRLRLLATGAIPTSGSELTINSAPNHAADYRIESAEVSFASRRGKMFDISAVWIPPFTA